MISNNTTIGDHSTYDNYYVAGNLSVAQNQSLRLINTNLIFENYSFIVHHLLDEGSLILINSSISLPSGASPNISRLDISVGTTNISGKPLFSLNGSSVSIYGNLIFDNANVSILNSSISSASQNVSTPSQSLSITSNGSSIFVLNSTIGGQYSSKPVGDFDAGNLYLTGVPLGVGGALDFNYQRNTSATTLVKSLHVSITYSGNNTKNYDYLSFRTLGKSILDYYFNSTGSYENQLTQSFNLSLNGSTIPLNEFQNDSVFSVFFNLSYLTTIDIWNMTISLKSNDTEALYGMQDFNIVLNHSTLVSVKGQYDLNYNKPYFYSKVLNPEKNALLLYNNSSTEFIGSSIDSSPSNHPYSPFEINTGSLAEIFVIEKIRDESAEGLVNNTENFVKSNSQNYSISRFVDETDLNVVAELQSNNVRYSNISSVGTIQIPLLANVMGYNNDPNLTYTGNYLDSVDSQDFYFSLAPFPDLSTNQSVFTVDLELPKLSATLNCGNMTIESQSQINVSIYSNFSGTSNVSFYLNLSSNISNIPISSQSDLSFSSNSTNIFSLAFEPNDSVHPGFHELELTVFTDNPTYHTNRVVLNESVEVYSNVLINISANYSYSAIQKETTFSVNISNSGKENVTNATIVFEILSNLTKVFSSSQVITISSEESLNLIYHSNCTNITGVEIEIEIPSFILPANTSGETLFLQVLLPHLVIAKYSIDFVQNGLKNGALWGISINGTEYNSSNNYICVSEENGTYSVIVQKVPGYRASIYQLNLVVLGKNETVELNWIPMLYLVTVSEQGLVQNTSWSILLNGTLITGNHQNISFVLPNGTYTLTFNVPANYTVSKNLTIVDVKGENVTVYLQFSPVKPLTHPASIWNSLLRYSPFAVIVTIIGLLYLAYYRKTSVMVCTKCGNSIPEGEKNCPSCRSIEPGDQADPQLPETAEIEEESGK